MVLGLSVNSRVIGLAAIRDQLLVDYKVRLFKERWSQSKAERILRCIESFMDEYPPSVAILVLPVIHHRTPAIKDIIQRIKRYFQNRGVPLRSCHPQSLQLLCGEGQAKKRALMKELSSRYPELTFVERKELRNRKKYYHKLFEAVGAAVSCGIDCE